MQAPLSSDGSNTQKILEIHKLYCLNEAPNFWEDGAKHSNLLPRASKKVHKEKGFIFCDSFLHYTRYSEKSDPHVSVEDKRRTLITISILYSFSCVFQIVYEQPVVWYQYFFVGSALLTNVSFTSHGLQTVKSLVFQIQKSQDGSRTWVTQRNCNILVFCTLLQSERPIIL